MARSTALTTRIREEVRKLARLYPSIVNCRIVIEQRGHDQSEPRSFNVRIVLGVLGHELVAIHDHDGGVYLALLDAFANLTRRLEDASLRQGRGPGRHGVIVEDGPRPNVIDEG